MHDGSARKQPFPIDVQLESIREIKLIDFFNGFLFKNFLVELDCMKENVDKNLLRDNTMFKVSVSFTNCKIFKAPVPNLHTITRMNQDAQLA